MLIVLVFFLFDTLPPTQELKTWTFEKSKYLKAKLSTKWKFPYASRLTKNQAWFSQVPATLHNDSTWWHEKKNFLNNKYRRERENEGKKIKFERHVLEASAHHKESISNVFLLKPKLAFLFNLSSGKFSKWKWKKIKP